MLGEILKTTSRTPHGVRGLKSLLIVHRKPPQQSHPSRGAWIEMKQLLGLSLDPTSHPSRGAWIEICVSARIINMTFKSHPSRGAWIEMLYVVYVLSKSHSRTPHGVRGLKYSSLFQRR